MFQLTMEEAKIWWTEVRGGGLRSQFVTLKRGQHIKYRPYAFTPLESSAIYTGEKKYDTQFKVVFDTIRKLMAPPEPEPPKRRIGFLVEEPLVPYKSLKGNKRKRPFKYPQ
jgi:hypothetical protein